MKFNLCQFLVKMNNSVLVTCTTTMLHSMKIICISCNYIATCCAVGYLISCYSHLCNVNTTGISGVAKGGRAGLAQALPNACCVLPPKRSRYSNRTVKFLLKQSVGQVVSCQLKQSGYATGRYEGSATQQNHVRDYVIFTILPRLHQDYAWITPRLH